MPVPKGQGRKSSKLSICCWRRRDDETSPRNAIGALKLKSLEARADRFHLLDFPTLRLDDFAAQGQ